MGIEVSKKNIGIERTTQKSLNDEPIISLPILSSEIILAKYKLYCNNLLITYNNECKKG